MSNSNTYKIWDQWMDKTSAVSDLSNIEPTQLFVEIQ